MREEAVGVADPTADARAETPLPPVMIDPEGRVEALQGLQPIIRRYFAQRVPRDAVEDLVHDVLVALLRQGAAPIRRLRAYAMVTAANLFNARLRERRRNEGTQQDPPGWGLPQPFAEPERSFVEQAMVEAVRETLAALPARTRQIFLLSRYGELSYPAIARQIGVSTSSVEKHMMRALAALRDVAAEHL